MADKNETPGPTEWLTDSEVAAMLKVDRSTISRWATKGPGKGARFDIRDAEPLQVGYVRRWPLDYLQLALRGLPVPTEAWRKRHQTTLANPA